MTAGEGPSASTAATVTTGTRSATTVTTGKGSASTLTTGKGSATTLTTERDQRHTQHKQTGKGMATWV